jgi:hypothetical protein
VVEGARPVKATLWLVTGVAFRVVDEPYAVVVPYSTCDEDASFVAQVIIAPVFVILLAVIPDITGGVVSGGVKVVKMLSPEVARLPAASRLRTL